MSPKPTYNELKQKVKKLEQEVTKRQQAEEALQEIEDQYCVLADHVADGVSLIQDGKIKFVNEAFASMYGYSRPNQLVGKHATDLICQEFKEQFSRIMKRLFQAHPKKESFKERAFPKKVKSFGLRSITILFIGMANPPCLVPPGTSPNLNYKR